MTTSEPDKFTVAFDANGGSGTIESITKTENEEFELPANTFTRTGYTFSGWSTDKITNESSKSYKDKEKITLTEDLTLYAQWKENPSYSINYNLNEGTNPEDARTSYRQDETVVLPVPTREFYDFAGWYLTQDFSDEAITGWNAGEKTGNITLYAKWTVKAENVVNVINSLTEGTYNICVVGKIDEDTVKSIGIALYSNENVKVNLDLSGTTGLESIPEFAFLECTGLTNIEIPESVTHIDWDAFRECIGLTDIKIPASVTIIEKNAFFGCRSLTNIEIPTTVTSIGCWAFFDCTNLTTVNYMGTIEQWKSISFDSGNADLTSAKFICTDGTINGD
ncbi:InlB B-repeat-containing protein [uncultured Treponema sp.]|uniref:InlB B-repeat-containing protein n=1 Tax=uncultured Treponema sp. TaxID=162155 RepID=UPI0025F38880|nr:InlB B-repeat-containing protein [Treponema sp. UBA7567]